MNPFVDINIAIELFSLTICLILLLCVITAEDRGEKLNRVFICVVCCHIPLLLADMVIFVLVGKSHSYLILRAAFFLSFILGAVLLILFTRYLLTFIGTKTTITRKIAYISYAAIAASGINILLVIITQFTGLYYFIDTGNVFRYGALYWMSQLLAAICIILNTGIMIACRKSFERREMVFLLSYAIFPALALAAQNSTEALIVSVDAAITLVIIVLFAVIQSQQAKLLKEKELELSKARIEVMLSQIQPHFLYNALNAIDDLYYDSADKGHEAMIAFSNYLRDNMDSLSQKKPVPFEQELAHTKKYLFLEKLRFEERLQIVYDIKSSDFMIPSLTLQPIAENAVRYGITKQLQGGVITIRTEETGDCFRITVTDNGIGFDPRVVPQDGRTHTGIDNVRRRLNAMCGGRLLITSAPRAGTSAVIEIPKVKGNSV